MDNLQKIYRNMKRLFIFFALALLSVGCDMSRSNVGLSVNLDPDQKDVVLVPGVGASYDLRFTSSSSWKADFLYAEDPVGWASISDTTGLGGYEINKLNLVIEKNTTGKRRTFWLIIRSSTECETILYTQGPFVSGLDDKEDYPTDVPDYDSPEDGSDDGDSSSPVFRLKETSAQVGAKGGTVYVIVQHNVDYECKLKCDWILELKTRSAYRESIHIFEVLPNMQAKERTYTIAFCGNEACVPFTITQEAASDRL